MEELLFSCGFLAGMVVTALIYAWSDRIRAKNWIRVTDGESEAWVGKPKL